MSISNESLLSVTNNESAQTPQSVNTNNQNPPEDFAKILKENDTSEKKTNASKSEEETESTHKNSHSTDTSIAVQNTQDTQKIIQNAIPLSLLLTSNTEELTNASKSNSNSQENIISSSPSIQTAFIQNSEKIDPLLTTDNQIVTKNTASSVNNLSNNINSSEESITATQLSNQSIIMVMINSSTSNVQNITSPELLATMQNATPSKTVLINTSMTDPQWSNSLRDHLVLFIGSNTQQAEIRLNSTDLGSIKIQLSVKADSVNLTILVQNHDTKQAIEAAVPALKDTLQANHLTLNEFSLKQETQNTQTYSDGHSSEKYKSNKNSDIEQNASDQIIQKKANADNDDSVINFYA